MGDCHRKLGLPRKRGNRASVLKKTDDTIPTVIPAELLKWFRRTGRPSLLPHAGCGDQVRGFRGQGEQNGNILFFDGLQRIFF